MRSRAEILASLTDSISPFTEVPDVQAKTLDAILETLLDIRDLQSKLNDRLMSVKPLSAQPTPGPRPGRT
jgi:hypothetical protein